jgi:hypothetical protein
MRLLMKNTSDYMMRWNLYFEKIKSYSGVKSLYGFHQKNRI